ncbi:MAG TPA: MarR family transcriptional regulator [Cyclobacteriaceae bacterium]|nr:MarR family transcriptional regulator [Cyclobacteriaceae bacterium]
MKIEEEIKQSKFRNAQQKAIINLIYTTNWLSSKQQDFMKPYGITSQQFNILRILRGQHPKSISGTEIKSRMLDRNSDVSRLLDRLAAKDLITKNICPQDKRAVDVSITNEGMKLLQTIDKSAEEMDSLLDLTEEEATMFSNLLDKARR